MADWPRGPPAAGRGGNRAVATGVLQNVTEDASITPCLTTSRLIWLAVLIVSGNAIRLLRGNLWSASTRLSSASAGPTFPAGSPRKTLPRRSF